MDLLSCIPSIVKSIECVAEKWDGTLLDTVSYKSTVYLRDCRGHTASHCKASSRQICNTRLCKYILTLARFKKLQQRGKKSKQKPQCHSYFLKFYSIIVFRIFYYFFSQGKCLKMYFNSEYTDIEALRLFYAHKPWVSHEHIAFLMLGNAASSLYTIYLFAKRYSYWTKNMHCESLYMNLSLPPY